jgi:L-ascorbate metabolism protein UlaG (beta-lactamase superfamily)
MNRMQIRFLGQACFELSEGDARVLVDPFLKPNNPTSPVTADELEPTHILLTHGHADHVADAVPLAKRTGAHCVALVEMAAWLKGQGIEAASDPNLGGTVEFDWGWVKLVQAFHTNTIPGSGEDPFSAETGVVIGQAAGLVINVGGTTVYHLGDTCLFGDMKLIAERTPVDVALIPIGGHYTMDRHDAVVAAELIGAGTVIPMHYNTFPPIEADAEGFKSDVESKTSSKVVILEPGESHDS